MIEIKIQLMNQIFLLYLIKLLVSEPALTLIMSFIKKKNNNYIVKKGKYF